MADELQAQAAQAATPPPAEPTPSPAPSAAPPSEPVSSPADSGGVQAAATAATPADTTESIRDYAKNLGVDLSAYADDEKAVQALLTAWRDFPRYQELARYGNEYLTQQQRAVVEQQRQQQAQQPQKPTSWWNPPAKSDEVQKLLAAWSYKDPATGETKLRPDTPPTVAEKVNAYAQHVQDWEHKLRHSPQEALRDAIREESQKLFAEQWAQHQVTQQGYDVIRRHQDWLFYKDQHGQAQIGSYTPAGQLFYRYVNQLENQGITDPLAVEQLALSLLQRDQLLAAQNAAKTPPAPAAPTPPGVKKPALQATGSAHAGATGLAAMLRDNLKAEGFDFDKDKLELATYANGQA